jgi:hypothetical protein
MRREDSPDLFGRGFGVSSSGDTQCEFCGTLYNEGADERGFYDEESINHTLFAGKTVCSCCFEIIEEEIISRMSDILPWFRRIIDHQKKRIEKYDEQLKGLGK